MPHVRGNTVPCVQPDPGFKYKRGPMSDAQRRQKSPHPRMRHAGGVRRGSPVMRYAPQWSLPCPPIPAAGRQPTRTN